MNIYLILAIVIGGILLLLLGIAVTIARLFRKVPQGQALVVSTMKSRKANLTGMVVLPIVHKAEVMDISVKPITIDRRGQNGLICKDNIRADIQVNFYVRVNPNEEDILRVAETVGCDRASNPTTLHELFEPKFSEALKTAGRQIDFEDLYTERKDFRDRITEIIGRDLDGYVLTDVAIDHLEQTKIHDLDPKNVLDSQGIRKIEEITSNQNVHTNEIRRNEEEQIRRKDVETVERVLELDRQQAEATARQEREVAAVQAREEAAAAVVQQEERKRSEAARIATDRDVQIAEENRMREVEVAEQDRMRVVGVEAEKVITDQEVEIVNRKVRTTEAERAVERELTEVSTLRRDRVAVDKGVAQEEEAIQTLRVVEDADRHKRADVLAAEAAAEAEFVKEIKAAEAAEAAANHLSKERTTLARAEQEAADMEATADTRRAEGQKALAAAPGLAEVDVKAANADAIEKEGMATMRVRTAEAEIVQKHGDAEAHAIQARGAAEGSAVEAKISGEAAGLDKKADALAKLGEAERNHEEYRLNLDAETRVRLAAVEAQKDIAATQAEAVGQALANANIDIVGGDKSFMDGIMGAIGGGKRVDGFVNNSDHTRQVLDPYLEGGQNLVGDLAAIANGVGTEGVAHLTLSAFLTQMMRGNNGGQAKQLLDAIEAAGLGNVRVGELMKGSDSGQEAR